MQILCNLFPICRPEHSGVLDTTVNGNVLRKIEYNNNMHGLTLLELESAENKSLVCSI